MGQGTGAVPEAGQRLRDTSELTGVTDPLPGGSTQPRVRLRCPFLSALYGPYLNSSHESAEQDAQAGAEVTGAAGTWPQGAGPERRPVPRGGRGALPLGLLPPTHLPLFSTPKHPRSGRGWGGAVLDFCEAPTLPPIFQAHPVPARSGSLGSQREEMATRKGSGPGALPSFQPDLNCTTHSPVESTGVRAQGERCDPTTFTFTQRRTVC